MSQHSFQSEIIESRPDTFSGWRFSICARLLIPVNGICLIGLLVLVGLDYRQESNQRLRDAQIELKEEAELIQGAIRQFRDNGIVALQEYITAASSRMDETHNAEHNIILEFKDQDMVLQSRPYYRLNKKELLLLRSSIKENKYDFYLNGHRLIVGVSQSGTTSIYLCETIDRLQLEILSESFFHLGSLICLGLLATLIMNIIIIKIVVRPIERLVGFVSKIDSGEFGSESITFRSRELDILLRSLNAMSLSLEKSKNYRDSLSRKARRIQQHLLPASLDIPGSELVARFEPADDVAGDFYDLRVLNDGS